jgi:FAD/FMN-containing dehydrogenase
VLDNSLTATVALLHPTVDEANCHLAGGPTQAALDEYQAHLKEKSSVRQSASPALSTCSWRLDYLFRLKEGLVTSVNLTQLSGGTTKIANETLAALRTRVRGAVLITGDEGYDTARTVWNAMVDRKPGLIVRCAGPADVQATVDFARNTGAVLSVRGGGHNIAGTAVCEGGVMIDLTPMKSVQIDAAARTARVEPGVKLEEFDREAQTFGLVTPTGINSTTGIAGLTLGGGFGWTTRKFGLTIDNLLSADVVTADGRVKRASDKENPDLFWALRGGGGNFGVVTSFEFRLHTLEPEVWSGLIVHPLADAKTLLRDFSRLAKEAPDELTTWAVMRKAPPLPFLPEEWHGKEVLIFATCYAGAVAEGEKATRALRALGRPIADVVSPHQFVGWQAAFDPLLTPGARNYWKSHDFVGLSDGAIDAILAGVHALPSPECEVFIAHVGGAMARIASDATAWPNRQAHFVMNAHGRWRDQDQDTRCIAWARKLSQSTAPFAMGSVYINFMPEDEADRIEQAYGENYLRLAEIKRRYDPDNLFRVNQNVRPARAAVEETAG